MQAWRRVKRKIKAVPGLISPRRELRPPLGECGLALVLRSRVELVSTAKQRQKEEKQEMHLRARLEVHCTQNGKRETHGVFSSTCFVLSVFFHLVNPVLEVDRNHFANKFFLRTVRVHCTYIRFH